MIRAFFSHSSVDKEIVRSIKTHLHRTWTYFDEDCFEAGEDFREAIVTRIENAKLFVLFASKNSIKSSWVKFELDEAFWQKVKRNNISYVTEIIGMQPISGLPETPDYIRGIVNLRGKIIPVIDVRLKFKKPAIDYTDRTCIIVIDTGAFFVGLIVDSVAEVLTLEDSQIVPPPDTRTGIQNRYIKGIGKTEGHVALLLDCEKLFSEEESEIINNSKNERESL